MRNFAANLILEEKITTTKTRARAVTSLVEKYITRAKKGGLPSRRLLLSCLPAVAVEKLFSSLSKRFEDRNGGYTRIIRLGQRFKDGAEMAVAEFIDYVAVSSADKKAKAKDGKAKSSKKAADKKDEKAGKIEKEEKEKKG